MERLKVKFTDSDAREIAKILKTKVKKGKNFYRFDLKRTKLEIYPKIKLGKKLGVLVSVYTPYSHLQIHFCTGYIASEILEEVTFFAELDGKVSGLVVESSGACHLYANLDIEVLHSDPTRLEPEVMISGIALSLGEILLQKKSKKHRDKDQRS